MTDFTMQNSILAQVHKGMHVYDLDGKRFGTVEFVHFGEENPNTLESETITGSNTIAGQQASSLVEDVARALFVTDDELPETLRGRLHRYGFIRVDTGWFSSDRYITADQIANVSQDRVNLNIRMKGAIAE